LMHTLAEAERSGSTCLPAPELLAEAGELLTAEVTEARIEGLVAEGHAVREEQWVYRRATAALEAELAERVSELLGGSPNPRLSEDRRRHVPADSHAPSELTAEQQAALEAALVHRL